ncbi:tRNA (adenosine(37)-N6)-threonylcarbamoyltransferase complex transferase subunit TsaD [Patescibacteria group bacterium]|nr:tRNA (adenosine(37)-N6)-threonylcarbamoyltransferase complex transferase subunit TsaD [Patescibacteria group bacterium]
MIILGIETSCDETAVAVIKVDRGNFKILSNVVSSQIAIHAKFGGIVPEVAARNHLKNMLPVLNQALIKAKVNQKKIDYIAVTNKPGLITSLLVGTETAKVLSYVWKKPLITVNHLKAHIYANWLPSGVGGAPASHRNDRAEAPDLPIKFPSIGLIVSGGHTELIYMKDKFSFKNIGQTLDDAAGEAFDKVAKILNLGYPGGPVISKMATKGKPDAFDFPRGMINSKDFNFSFSGIKTSVLYKVRGLKKLSVKQKTGIAASFEKAVVDVLVKKTIDAATKYKVKTILLGGGVTANKLLRNEMKKNVNVDLLIPSFNLCTDNAAIIAAAAYFKILKKDFTPWSEVKVEPN